LLFHSVSEIQGYSHRSQAPWNGWEKEIINSANTGLTKDFTVVKTGQDEWTSARGFYARDLALAYYITGDARYRDKAVDALLHLDVGKIPTPGDNPGMMIDAAWPNMALQGYCLAYDWMQPYLTASQDSVVRDKLATLADKDYFDLTHPSLSDPNKPDNQYLFWVDFHGQAYPTLGIAGVVLNDYTNPNHLALSSGPADWLKAGTEYLFVDDKLHANVEPGRSLMSFEFDKTGKDLHGAYKAYFIDDLVLWAQVYSHYYNRNIFTDYPILHDALTEEVWSSLPNEYSSNFVTGGDTKWSYHRGIANLLNDTEKAYVLNHDDIIDKSNVLPYSQKLVHIYDSSELPAALLYIVYADYSNITRKYPSYTSHLSASSDFQVFRGSWASDTNWLSLTTWNTQAYANRNMGHQDQLNIEYYGKGDLALADAGEPRWVIDRLSGHSLDIDHNTVMVEDPRNPFPVSTWSGNTARGMKKGHYYLYTPAPVTTVINTPWMETVGSKTTMNMIDDPNQWVNFSSPIGYERDVLYPDKDYFIVIDRMEGSQTWGWRNVFRPSSFGITPTSDKNGDGVFSASEVGHTNVNLALGNSSYNWQALPYNQETNAGVSTSLVKWTATNPYGKNIETQLYSVPSSQIMTEKQVSRIGGYSPSCEVYIPIVYYKSPPSTTMYRATVALSRYTNETAKTPQTLTVNGNGNAMKVVTPNYEDTIYTGKGTSTIGPYTTDANTIYVRSNGKPVEYTMLGGTYINYGGTPLASVSNTVNYLTLKRQGTSISFEVNSKGNAVITIPGMSHSLNYQILRDGKKYSLWTMSGDTIKIVTDNGEHRFDISPFGICG